MAKMADRTTTEEFISKAKKIHGNKYDYSKTKYINNNTKVIITCSKHGDFSTRPKIHLGGSICSLCSYEYRKNKSRSTKEEFIEKAKKVHKNKYDYTKVKYINSKTKVKIICPKHGEFEQKPKDHIAGKGCQKCKTEKIKNRLAKTTKDFILDAQKVHGNKYDYSKTKYINNAKKVKIICAKHGEFEQKPNNHLNGIGCPICSESKLENYIRNFLEKENIEFKTQKTFKWLKNKEHMYLDFYLPKSKIGIECQGKQHFKPVEYFGGKERYKETIHRDDLKNELCKKHDINIIYFANNEAYINGYKYPVITSEKEIKKFLKTIDK